MDLAATALAELRLALKQAFQSTSMEVTFSWAIDLRAVSEIGGRLIENFVLNSLAGHLPGPSTAFRNVRVNPSTTGRTIDDFSVVFEHRQGHSTLKVDVKGHNQLNKGSRPNLTSVRKCLELYEDPTKESEEVVIFYCRYEPKLESAGALTRLRLEILPESFEEKGVFLLRHLSRSNLFRGNIGQMQLAREDNLQLELRSREDFVTLVKSL